MRPRPGDAQVIAIAQRRDGVVTAGELAGAGLSPKAIAHRVASGWLSRVHRGVYMVGAVAGPFALHHAALLALGARAALSHDTSGELSAIRPGRGGPIHVTAPTARHRSRSGLVVHHARLAERDVIVRHGLRITAPERTLIDLAATLDPRALDRAVNEAQVLRLTDAPRLHRYLAEHAGHRGAEALRAALRHEPRLTRSALEATMLALVRRLGLPPPRTNVLVLGYEVDFLWPEQKLIVETDGFGTHGTRRAFEHDRGRDAHLQAAGYRVLRFTWRQVEDEPEIVAARLAVALMASVPGGATVRQRPH